MYSTCPVASSFPGTRPGAGSYRRIQYAPGLCFCSLLPRFAQQVRKADWTVTIYTIIVPVQSEAPVGIQPGAGSVCPLRLHPILALLPITSRGAKQTGQSRQFLSSTFYILVDYTIPLCSNCPVLVNLLCPVGRQKSEGLNI